LLLIGDGDLHVPTVAARGVARWGPVVGTALAALALAGLLLRARRAQR
jgi:hypothetical protein